jgi:antitoxin component of MazEF toxin-antitoxin module
MKFTTTIMGSGNKAGIEVPEDVISALGAGKRPPVVVTINGKSYRSSVAVMGGQNLIG